MVLRIGQMRGLAILMLGGFVCPASAEPVSWANLQDPQVRIAQYSLQTDNAFDALSQLLADQALERIKVQPQQADLVLGGLYLANGAHHKAAEIFKSLGESDQPVAIRNLAWYQLAQLQYQRGLQDDALEALDHIEGDLKGADQQGRLLLEAMLQMRYEQYGAAEIKLQQLHKASLSRRSGEANLWPTYGRFNLGVALYRQGKSKEAIKILTDLGAMEVSNEEDRTLRDKANLTLAYYYLGKDDVEQAEQYFNKTRLDGALSNKALLGLGRAHVIKEDYKKALVPWLELIKRDASDTAVQDGLLAVPFAFGKLNALKQALEHYQQALTIYKQEMERVQEAETLVNNGNFLAELERKVSAQQPEARWRVADLPVNPGSRYLWPLLSSHEFQQGLNNYAQLNTAKQRVAQWTAYLAQAKDIPARKRQAFEERIRRLTEQLTAMEARVQGHLQDLSLKELQKRKQRLVGYAGEARFSMAQIYDYAAKRWGNEK